MENKNTIVKEITYIPDVFCVGIERFFLNGFGKLLLKNAYDKTTNSIDLNHITYILYRVRSVRIQDFYRYYANNRITRYEKMHETAERREIWYSKLREIVSDFLKTHCRNKATLSFVSDKEKSDAQVITEQATGSGYEHRFCYFFALELQDCFKEMIGSTPAVAVFNFRVCLN